MKNVLSENQKKALELKEDKTLTNQQRADKMGVGENTYNSHVRRAKVKLAKMGHAPKHDMTHTVPEGFMVKGVSTCYDKDGQMSQQWVKSTIDREAQYQLMLDAIADACKDVKPVEPAKQPDHYDSDLANLFTITDYHLGMLAWREEGGDDWDLNVAEKTLISTFDSMIETAPKAEYGIVAQLGDFLHSDGLAPVTPTNGHLLDQDSRYAKIVRVAIRLIRYMVDKCLTRHKTVYVLMAEGNHDLASSIWMRELLSALYGEDERVIVNTSPNPFYALRHGKVMLGFHHGHMKKTDQVPLVMATQFAKDWGNTEYRYCHTGHCHHQHIKEHSGITVEQHQTLAAKDAHSSRHGYFSNRGAVRITYHKLYGEVGRETKRPEMFNQ